MKKILCNKKYSGILWAAVIAGVFVAISFWVRTLLSGTAWYAFSGALRFAFGFIILAVVKRLYNRPVKEILSLKGGKNALFAGCGFLIYFLYYIIVWSSGVGSVKGLTAGVIISRIIFQQLATGFYEELNYRVIVLEGYFHGVQNMGSKLIYGFASFLIFGAVHIVDGWDTYRFLQTGIIGFAFAVMYLKSRNISMAMLLHFLYDIFANLTNYIEWNNSTLFVGLNSIFEIMLGVMFVVSLAVLLKKEQSKKEVLALN